MPFDGRRSVLSQIYVLHLHVNGSDICSINSTYKWPPTNNRAMQGRQALRACLHCGYSGCFLVDHPMLNSLHAGVQTIQESGVRGLFKGMGAPLTTVALFNAVLFATRGQMENLLAHEDGIPPVA